MLRIILAAAIIACCSNTCKGDDLTVTVEANEKKSGHDKIVVEITPEFFGTPERRIRVSNSVFVPLVGYVYIPYDTYDAEDGQTVSHTTLIGISGTDVFTETTRKVFRAFYHPPNHTYSIQYTIEKKSGGIWRAQRSVYKTITCE